MFQEINSRILLVEDDSDTRFALAMLFEMEGYEVICAANGEEAFARAMEDYPDLIVTDINMPKVDGLDLIRMLRSDPRTEATPIVAMSAVDKQHLSLAMDLGADAVLQKPFEFDQFIPLIARLVSPPVILNRNRSHSGRRRSLHVHTGPVGV